MNGSSRTRNRTAWNRFISGYSRVCRFVCFVSRSVEVTLDRNHPSINYIRARAIAKYSSFRLSVREKGHASRLCRAWNIWSFVLRAERLVYRGLSIRIWLLSQVYIIRLASTPACISMFFSSMTVDKNKFNGETRGYRGCCIVAQKLRFFKHHDGGKICLILALLLSFWKNRGYFRNIVFSYD